MKVGIIQQYNGADHMNNVHRLQKHIRQLTHKGTELIVLQKLHNGLCLCQTEDVALSDQAEAMPSPSAESFGTLARGLGVVVVLLLFEKHTAGLYHNTAIVLKQDGSIAGHYRRVHIPGDSAYYERFCFTPGDLGLEPIDTSVGCLDILICRDQWCPEAAWFMALKGVELLTYPTAMDTATYDTPEEQQCQIDAWQLVRRGHAVANNLPVIAVNRIGFKPDLLGVTGRIQFWDHGFVADQQGEMLCDPSQTKETGVVVELSLERTELVRHWWPYLRDRRIDSYGEITRRYIG